MNCSKELCQKSVADIVKIIDSNPILSPTFTETVNESKKILLIIDKNVPLNLVDRLTQKIGNKEYKIITPFEYNAKKYDFFGITKGHIPVLIDEEFLKHDTVIAVSFVKYHYLLGYTGGKNLIFTGISSEKSRNSLYKKAIDIDNCCINEYCKAGNTKNNIIDSQCIDSTMIIRQNAYYFAINLIGDIDNNIVDVTCGDLFMSHNKACEIFSSIYPLPNNNSSTGKILVLDESSLQNQINIIAQALIGLEKGGRLFIDATKVEEIGSKEFIEALYIGNVEEICNKMSDDFNIDIMEAFIIKDIARRYHIAVSSNLDKDILRQAGLNNIDIEEKGVFLKDCNNVSEVFNANGFTASR